MGKSADKYFKTAPWEIIEEGFVPGYGLVSESVFSLANEYMGARGYFEEGYTGETLVGSYCNGVYESRCAQGQGYKGSIQETEFMVNAADWLHVRIWAGEERLDMAVSRTEGFRRILDMRTGLLTRSLVWRTAGGHSIDICFERLVSMKHVEAAAQRVSVTSVDYEGSLTICAGIDFDTVHGAEKESFWKCSGSRSERDGLQITGRTIHTGRQISVSCILRGSIPEEAREEDVRHVADEKRVYAAYTLSLTAGQTATLEKQVLVRTPLADKSGRGPVQTYRSFELLYEENRAWWQETWERSDIEIDGDADDQQGIRFCIFQMFQTYHGAAAGTNIGAKGLTGEAYNGNAFWDTETYCLPFFLFHNRQAAYNLLYFRYATLEEARKRAAELDCAGAFYPIATISGRECCNLWQHASLQLQASTAVAYGIWLYGKVTGDDGFLMEYGLEILTEICRMLATRGDYNAEHTKYGFYGVMGPDEFQMMVNHNCYTNYMGRFTFRYALEAWEKAQKTDGERAAALAAGFHVTEEEKRLWRQMAADMYIPYDAERKLHEQHQGYFGLPHVDIDGIPVEQFPLYHHWSYDRIYRNDMIKQPDVLMFLLLFNSEFTEEEIRNDYEYYEPRCIHESSLSPSVHSILAAQLHKEEEAYELFGFATRMDLDNYNRNSGEGLHTTSIAAAWMNIVYGFGGLRCDGEALSLSPSIPSAWQGYRFRIVYGGDVICVSADKQSVRLKTLHGSSLTVRVYGQDILLDGVEQRVSMPSAGGEGNG